MVQMTNIHHVRLLIRSSIKRHDVLQPNLFLTEETIQNDERQFDDPMTTWNIYNLLKRGKHRSI